MQVPDIQTIRPYLELLSFVSTLAIAIFAYRALDQIKLAKGLLETAQKDIELRSTREAVTLAAHRCEKFAEVLLPKHTRALSSIWSQGIIKKVTWELNNPEFDNTSLKKADESKIWMGKLNSDPNAFGAFIVLLNDLESFAVYFMKGAADEQVAYPSVGTVFCHWMEIVAPILIALRSGADAAALGLHDHSVTSGSYPNSVGLYKVWASRLNKEKTGDKFTKAALEHALAQARVVDSPPPIGTKGN